MWKCENLAIEKCLVRDLIVEFSNFQIFQIKEWQT